MKKIIFEEFGVRTEITKYKELGKRLKGMREGKPFISDGQVKVNIGDKLYLAEEVRFFDKNGDPLQRKDVRLDTEHRIAGIVVNSSNEILLLKISELKPFFCFPGGHQRECESKSTCLKREMLEETGIDIKDADITVLIQLREEGFGQESFYLINIGNKEIVYRDENPENPKSSLGIHEISKALSYKNVLPTKVLAELKKTYK